MKEEACRNMYMVDYRWIEEPYVVINWEDHWYKIPFFVLEDILQDCFRSEKKTKVPDIKKFPLMTWLNSWKSDWKEKPVFVLKQILKDEMPGMEAYRLYE